MLKKKKVGVTLGGFPPRPPQRSGLSHRLGSLVAIASDLPRGGSMDTAGLSEILRRYARDSAASWSCGSFGAIAEFVRAPDEPAAISADEKIAVVTGRGALGLDPTAEFRPIAYELPSRHPEAWQHGLALCLPVESPDMTRRKALTELGPDGDALRPAERDAILFDLGLGVGHAELCVRTADPDALALLRANLGWALLAPMGSRYCAPSPPLIRIGFSAAALAASRSTSRFPAPRTRRRTVRILTSCRACWHWAARTRQPCRSRRAGCRA
jgi:hypothetical protein